MSETSPTVTDARTAQPSAPVTITCAECGYGLGDDDERPMLFPTVTEAAAWAKTFEDFEGPWQINADGTATCPFCLYPGDCEA